MNHKAFILALGLAFSINTMAEDEASLPLVGDSSRVYDLDEVEVVVQPKESFRLRLQPISSTLFSRQQIERQGMRDLNDVALHTPSLVMPRYGSRLTSTVFVRGIGNRLYNPSVTIYSDGIPLMTKSAFNTHLYQLSRVDVLRGPQGVLYGRNSESGLLRLYSINPFRYQGTDIRLGLGTHMYRNAEIAHYHRFSPHVALSLAGFYNGQNGFFRNANTGNRADQMNEAGGRLRLMYHANDRIDLDYTADYQYVRQNGFPYGEITTLGEQPQGVSTTFDSNYRRNIFNTGLTFTFHANDFDFNSTSSYQYLKDYMLMDQDYEAPDYMHLVQRQFQNAITEELSLKGNHAVGGFWRWTLGSFFSYSWMKTQGPVYFGPAMTSKIAQPINAAMTRAIISAMAGRMIAQGMPAAAAQAAAERAVEKAGGISLDVDMSVPGLFRTPQMNLAFYHQSDFDITSRLTATLGLRYDYSRVKIEYITSAAMAMNANVMGKEASYVLSSALNGRDHNDFNQLLPKFGLTWRIDDSGSNIYAQASKGYCAGGYNFQMFSDVLQTELSANSARAMRGSYDIPHTDADYDNINKTISFKPETSWNYEVGSHLNLFGNSVHLDVAAYFMQIKNQQLSVMAGNYGYGRMMVNAGKTHSCGLEATLRGNSLGGHLDWALSYAYTRATFRDYKDSLVVDGKKQGIDYKDNYVPYVPQWNGSAMVDYNFLFAQGAIKRITLGASGTFFGRTYWDAANSYHQHAYALLGAHADADFGWLTLSLWGRNLTNTKYTTFATDDSASGQRKYFGQKGNPIQAGIDIRMHF